MVDATEIKSIYSTKLKNSAYNIKQPNIQEHTSIQLSLTPHNVTVSQK